MSLTIKKVIEKLESGQVGVMPFDTVWGLGGLMAEGVVKRMASLKNRSDQKPFLMLIPKTLLQCGCHILNPSIHC